MKKTVYKLEVESGDVIVYSKIEGVMAEIESIDVDDNTNIVYKITVTTMEEEDYYNLPEFNF